MFGVMGIRSGYNGQVQTKPEFRFSHRLHGGVGSGRQEAELASHGKHRPVDMGGNDEGARRARGRAEFVETGRKRRAEIVVGQVQDVLVDIHNDLIAELLRIVGQIGQDVPEAAPEIERLPFRSEDAEDVDFLHAARLDPEKRDQAFPTAGLAEGRAVQGRIVVSEGQESYPPFTRFSGEDGRREVQGTAGTEAGVVVEVGENPHDPDFSREGWLAVSGDIARAART